MINLRNVWEMGEDSAAMAACPFHPPFSFPSCGKENGPWTVQKKRPLFTALRCSGPPRDGGLPSRCRQRLSAFCQLAPDRSVESALRRVSGAAENRSDQRMALLLSPLPLHGPAREGQRQRKSALTVSETSPGLDDPKGSAFPSLVTARDGQPSPAGGRRSACMRTDPPKHFFF